MVKLDPWWSTKPMTWENFIGRSKTPKTHLMEYADKHTGRF